MFTKFLERILPSEALRRFVQRVVGYAATGEVSEKVFAILHGVGANGKSTLVNAIMETLGDYAKQAAPYLLLVKHSSHPIQLANLFGARFVASDETDEGRRLAERLVKKLTGREPRPHKGSPDAPYRVEQRMPRTSVMARVSRRSSTGWKR